MTKNPEILAKCELCDHEWCMHPLDEVRLVGGDTWMCKTCFDDCDEPPHAEWKTLPQASEWVTVREDEDRVAYSHQDLTDTVMSIARTVEKQEALVYVRDSLAKYVDYINNTGQVPLPTLAFRDDWEPIGDNILVEMVRDGLVRIDQDGIVLHEQLRRNK